MEIATMQYRTLLVHLEVAETNRAVLGVARELASRFDAAVTGIACCQPVQMLYNDGYVSGDVIEQDRADIESGLGAAQAEFRDAFAGVSNRISWRDAVTLRALHDFVATEARCADLVMTGAVRGGMLHDWTRHADNGGLVMQAGRPVLIVPRGIETLTLGHVLVAWKDTREARRAVADSVPLLRHAAAVTIVEFADDHVEAARRVADVGGWFKRQDIKAETRAPAPIGDDAQCLGALANDLHADLVVAGAYGHSRLREWALGGVTRDLLIRPARCALVSH
jgi:nucleotide-binding universal stress UspA family protein